MSIKYGSYIYHDDHFANMIENEDYDNFIIAVRRFEKKTENPIDVLAILCPEDCRGWRIIIKLVNRFERTKAFNRKWTHEEVSAVTDLATLIYDLYQELGLVPQLRRDGLLGIRYNDDKLEYGTEIEPHRLFIHVIGRQLPGQKTVQNLIDVPFIDPGRQFTLAKYFDPWTKSSNMKKLSLYLQSQIKCRLSQYNLLEYQSDRIDEKLIKSIPTVQWSYSRNKDVYRRSESHIDGLIVARDSRESSIIFNANSKYILPPPISKDAFNEWLEREKKENRLLAEYDQFVIWQDIKQSTAPSIYWCVWFTDPLLVTLYDLRKEHIVLLEKIKKITFDLLESKAKDSYFDLIVHDPPKIGRLHIQIIPSISSVHHCSIEHLYTLSSFSITLDRLINELKIKFN